MSPHSCPWASFTTPRPNKKWHDQLNKEENTVKIATLIDIDIDHNHDKSANETIYADFTSHEFGLPQVEQVVWGGLYPHKPQAQTLFEVDVQRAVESIVAATERENDDYRPRIKDLISGRHFLIDTGACLSVYPKKLCPSAKVDEKTGLKAVNGATMPTYGTIKVKIRLDRKVFVLSCLLYIID